MKIIKYIMVIPLAAALFFLGVYIGAADREQYIYDRVRFSGKYYEKTIDEALRYIKSFDPKGGIELFPTNDGMGILVRVKPGELLTEEGKAEIKRLLNIRYIEEFVPGLSGLD